MKPVVANARGNPGSGGPFCWQSLFILRHLREVGESAKSVSGSALLSVYMALTELAADRYEPSFRVSVSEIAARAQLGYRTASTALRLIEEAGIIHVQNNFLGGGALKTRNTYTLLQHDASICKFCLSHGEGKKSSALPISVEDKGEEMKEERTALPSLNNPMEAWVLRAGKAFPERADIHAIATKFSKHYENKPKACCYERFLEWIQDERNPKIRRVETASAGEPDGWREHLQKNYPVADYPTREIYEKGGWSRVPQHFRKIILEELKSTG